MTPSSGHKPVFWLESHPNRYAIAVLPGYFRTEIDWVVSFGAGVNEIAAASVKVSTIVSPMGTNGVTNDNVILWSRIPRERVHYG